MKKLLVLGVLVASVARAGPGGRVAGSKHDLSASGPGPYRAVSERSPCVFCHATHGVAPGLDNRPETFARHRPYESSTMKGRAATPTGVSRMCLSCHDGTIALGATRKRAISMVGADRLDPGRRSNLGTDLRGTHPVSFHSAPGDGTTAPPAGDPVKLDRSGQIQCTSCHDPHAEWGDPRVGKFLVKPSAGSALCLSCHASAAVSGTSSHARSSAPIVSAGGTSTTVSEAGCSACHDTHGADVRGRLLKPGGTDDETCLGCHSGVVARKDVGVDVRKAWGHASTNRGVHDAAERPDAPGRQRLPEPSPGAPRHVSCVDCHDPHASSPEPAVAPMAPGALAGTWGTGIDGQRVEPARFEYEVCLKCHGDSANKPQASGSGPDSVRRAYADVNLRRVFSASSPSYHPVAAPGRNPIVPSLRPPYSAASLIYCSDCHASDNGPGAGGAGARGPHGSVFPHLLERQYQTADFTPEGPAAYALCYKCHDRDVLLSARSGFPLHRSHVVDASAPCSACHDAHGVSSDAGNDRENAHLVSFDVSIVRPGPGGRSRYTSDGPSRGSCNLTCHGRAHDDLGSRY